MATSSEVVKGYASVIVALAAIGLFILLIREMLGLIGSEEPMWSRAVHLLTGVEAIAFSAAGFLFGKEVHRQQAEKAMERADKAEATLDGCRKQVQESEKYYYQAQDLARVIISKAKAIAIRTKDYASLETGAIAKIIDSEFEELVTLVSHMFPEMDKEFSMTGETKSSSIDVDLGDTDIRNGLRNLQFGYFDSALEDFERAIQKYPKDDYAWYNKGIICSILGKEETQKAEEAIKCFDHLIETIDPLNSFVNLEDVWYQKGKVLKYLGRYDKAKEAFAKAGIWEQGYASG